MSDTDTTVVAEVVEAPVVDQDAALNELLGLEDPVFSQENYTGMRPLSELIRVLPEDTRKQLANLRGSVTRKEQALAAERKALTELRAQIDGERKAILESVNSYKAPEGDIDIWSEEGQAAAIERKVAEKLQAMYKPMQDQLFQVEQERKAEQFVSQNPDVRTDPEIKSGVAKLLMEREELSLEDAYYIVKAKVGDKRSREASTQRTQAVQAQRGALAKTSAGGPGVGVGTPAFKKADGSYDALAHLAFMKAQGRK